MAATLAFYRGLGWTVETAPGGEHAGAAGAGPLRIEFDTADSAAAVGTAASPGTRSGAATLTASRCPDARTRVDADAAPSDDAPPAARAAAALIS